MLQAGRQAVDRASSAHGGFGRTCAGTELPKQGNVYVEVAPCPLSMRSHLRRAMRSAIGVTERLGGAYETSRVVGSGRPAHGRAPRFPRTSRPNGYPIFAFSGPQRRPRVN